MDLYLFKYILIVAIRLECKGIFKSQSRTKHESVCIHVAVELTGRQHIKYTEQGAVKLYFVMPVLEYFAFLKIQNIVLLNILGSRVGRITSFNL